MGDRNMIGDYGVEGVEMLDDDTCVLYLEGFNEGDVAPMYMGTVEFEIPAEVLSAIRK